MSLSWLFCFLILLFGQASHQDNRRHIVSNGSSLKLECKFEQNVDRVRWMFTDINKDSKGSMVYDNHDKDHGVYQADCQIESKFCNLEIQAFEKDAGKYSCLVSISGQSYEAIIEYDVIVGKLNCSSNILPNQRPIAKSDCRQAEATSLEKTCTLEYIGMPTSNIPLRWRTEWWHNGSYAGPEYATDVTASPSNGGRRLLTMKEHVPVTIDMKDQHFQCSVLGQPKLLNCHIEVPTVLYARNKTEKSEMLQNAIRSVTCQADTSTGLHCRYAWTHRHHGSEIQIIGQELDANNIVGPGTYTCIATCDLGNYKGCMVLADEFELIPVQNSSLLIGLIVGAILVLLLVIAVILFVCYRRKKGATKGKNDERTKAAEIPLKGVVVEMPAAPAPSSTNHPVATPVPSQSQSSNTPLLPGQSRNGGGGVATSGRKHSFKRGHSTKGSQDFQPIREEGGESSPGAGENNGKASQVGPKITLNDARGPIMGVCHLTGRIFCVAKGSTKLFTFVDSPPFNRMIPEEVIIKDLTNPQGLVACPRSQSVYVSDYNDNNSVHRVFPKIKEDNKICKGKLDGSPGCISLVGSKPDTVVVILKRDRKMYVEVYDSSSSLDSQGSVMEWATWEKKHVIQLINKDISLPLFLSVSNEDINLATPQKLYLLYGSGKFSSSGEFNTYKISQINLETSRVLTTCDLKDILQNGSEKFVPSYMINDDSRGGVLLCEKSKGQIVHVNPDLNLSDVEVKIEAPLNRFCLGPKDRMIILGSNSSRASLICYQLKDRPTIC